MKKILILPVLTFLMVGGIFALGQQSKSAHAQASIPTVVQKTVQTSEKLDTKETTAEVKGTEVAGASEPKGAETDGPGGHQDPQGTNVDHQFNGAE